MNEVGVVRISFLLGAGNAGISWVFGGFFALELQTEMMVQNFVPFCYWKSSKFAENLENTCIECSNLWTIL